MLLHFASASLDQPLTCPHKLASGGGGDQSWLGGNEAVCGDIVALGVDAGLYPGQLTSLTGAQIL